MKDINKSLESFLKEMQNYELASYERLPDIDLYMDQVINYLNRYMRPFTISSLDKTITPSMINNYVKAEVIKAPVNKRYNKEHLALIFEVCFLKKALNIGDIKKLLQYTYHDKDFLNAYNNFKDLSVTKLHEEVDKALEKLSSIKTNDELALINLALELSLEASFKMLISERIMDYLRIYNDLKEEK